MPVHTELSDDVEVLRPASDESSGGDPIEDGGTETLEADGARAITDAPAAAGKRFSWRRVFAFVIVPGLAMALAVGVGYLKFQYATIQHASTAAKDSVQAATATAIAMLSYHPDTVDKDLHAAQNLMTGSFRDDYIKLIDTVVIPGAKEKQISADAKVPAAASISANNHEAKVLLFVDQTVLIGKEPPSNTASAVRVTLDKVDDRWLISHFDPV